MYLKLRPYLKELRFLQLTVYMLLFLILSPLLANRLLINVLVQIFILDSLLVSLSAGGDKRHHRWVLLGLWAASVIFYLLGTLSIAPALNPLWRLLDIAFTILLLLGCIAATLTFIFRSHRVTLDTIFAAVVVYLFLAFTYAQIYHLLSLWEPGSFQLASAGGPDGFPIFQGEMIYFSLVTIATLGYGDIVPQMPMPRMLAAVEAVMGQFYVAILVAWLVGMFISHSLRSKQPGANENRQ